MNIKRLRIILVAALILMGGLATQSAVGADTLYIGDGDDDTVKSFDADTGTFNGNFVNPGSGGLRGPRGLLIDGDSLLVSNQNVNLKISGEILRYNSAGEFQGALVPSSDKNAPFAPQGIILGPELYVADILQAGKATGRVRKYDIEGNFLGDLDPKAFQNNNYHPLGLVFGPDGNLYVSVRDLKKDQLGGHVLRFKPDGSFDKVFISDNGGVGHLNRPRGLVFGPDGQLYITSFRANAGDTSAIRIYSSTGIFQRQINLDEANGPTTRAQSLLFGPNGCLFVPIFDTGEVRRYKVGIEGEWCDAVAPYDTFIDAHGDPVDLINGELGTPWYMTFGQTDSKTLKYLGN